MQCLVQVEVGGRRVVVGVWDTAGSERYEAMTSMYYRCRTPPQDTLSPFAGFPLPASSYRAFLGPISSQPYNRRSQAHAKLTGTFGQG